MYQDDRRPGTRLMDGEIDVPGVNKRCVPEGRIDYSNGIRALFYDGIGDDKSFGREIGL